MDMKSVKRQLSVYLREEEYQSFILAFRNTVYRSQTDYARNLVLGKPVRILTRNRSLDDFVEIGVKIRKVLLILSAKDAFTSPEKDDLIHHIERIEASLNKIVQICGQE